MLGQKQKQLDYVPIYKRCLRPQMEQLLLELDYVREQGGYEAVQVEDDLAVLNRDDASCGEALSVA